MNFFKFINESNQPISIDDFKKSFKNDCKEWFKNNSINNLLFRGIKNETKEIFKGKVLKNRKPKDSAQSLHDFYNKIFIKKFKILLRSQSLFCVQTPIMTVPYGQRYIIFPINNYTLYGSNLIKDLYLYNENIYDFHIMMDDFKNKSLDSLSLFYKKFQNNDKWNELFFYVDQVKNKWITDKWWIDKNNLENILNSHYEKYKNDLIKDEIDSYKKSKKISSFDKNSEIMVYCDEYYAISYNTYEDIKNEFS